MKPGKSKLTDSSAWQSAENSPNLIFQGIKVLERLSLEGFSYGLSDLLLVESQSRIYSSSILLTVQYRSICLYKFLYDLMKGEYLIHTEEAEGKTLNGESRIVVNKDGNDIIVF